MAPIHDRMTSFLDRGDYSEYLALSERPPIHLLRIFPVEKMRAQRAGETPFTHCQVGLFDSQ
jgi:putative SOS response-associated peptidase YedK